MDEIHKVWERFRHLDAVLSGAACDDDPIHCAARDLWLAVKAHCETSPWTIPEKPKEATINDDQGV